MQPIETKLNRYTPSSVPTATQVKVYYADDIRAAGNVDAWLQTIGSDKAKQLPEIDISEEEWNQMLKESF